ncbi:MAG: glycosyltransferase [Nitrospirota bacterium]
MNSLVSIIIPVKNGQKTIKKCLDSLEKLNYDNYEIIVIDDNSSDGTRQILNSYSGIQVIKTLGIGPSGCRNLGIKLSKGEYLAFTDADCLVHPEWLNELHKGFELVETKNNPLTPFIKGEYELHKGFESVETEACLVVGVGGDQQSPEDETEFGKLVQAFLKTVGFVADYVKGYTPSRTSQTSQTNHNPTCNVMYRKEVFGKVGGFLEELWPGEDVELDYRIKKTGKLMYNPRAIVYHYRPDKLWKFCKMMERYGYAQGFLVRKYGAFRLIHYEPVFLFILFSSIISLLVYNLRLGIGCLVFCLLMPAIYFFIKAKSIRFIQLFVATIVNWNLGFVKGLIK